MNRVTRISAIIKQFMHHIIDTVLPPRCPVTGEIVSENGVLSPAAWKDLDFISDPLCSLCGYPMTVSSGETNQLCGACIQNPPYFDRARAPVAYNPISREIALKFKHGDQLHVVKTIAAMMRRSLMEVVTPCSIIIPVPLHPRRLLARRYNQAALIAGNLSALSDLPMVPDFLLRRKSTPPQKDKSFRLRKENVRAAFCVNPAYVQNASRKDFILIDDVYTTGATVNECARVLKKADARSVFVLTFARTVRFS